MGIKRIYGFTCNHKPITTALEKLGFQPSENTEIVYEKTINNYMRGISRFMKE
jgi:hypothetical protein